MKRLTLPLLLLSLGAAPFGSVSAQSAATQVTRPANDWMKVPTLHSAHDNQGVPEPQREERDRYWDLSPAGSFTPLTLETASVTAMSNPSSGPGRKEIPDLPERAIVTAVFKSAKSILTASGRCVYTDISFQVDQVFESSNRKLTPKSTITVSIPGGTVLLANGKIMSYLTQPKDLFVQPLHHYLLILSYHSVGDFFSSVSNWEVVGGTLRANDPYTSRLARDGKSWIESLTVEQFSRTLPLKLSGK